MNELQRDIFYRNGYKYNGMYKNGKKYSVLPGLIISPYYPPFPVSPFINKS